MYQNDKIVNHSKAISQRIEWATELKLRHETFASENFQVMNYGIGGKISPHVDAFGEKFSKESIGKLMFRIQIKDICILLSLRISVKSILETVKCKS